VVVFPAPILSTTFSPGLNPLAITEIGSPTRAVRGAWRVGEAMGITAAAIGNVVVVAAVAMVVVVVVVAGIVVVVVAAATVVVVGGVVVVTTGVCVHCA
jgi:hypothetical protein